MSGSWQALDSGQVKNLGIVAIVIIVVVGLVIARLITKVIIRAIVLVIAIVLAVVVYTQRQQVSDAAGDAAKKCDISFFGFHVSPSDPTVKAECQKLGKANG